MKEKLKSLLNQYEFLRTASCKAVDKFRDTEITYGDTDFHAASVNYGEGVALDLIIDDLRALLDSTNPTPDGGV